MWIDKDFVNYYFEGGKMSVQTLGRFTPGSTHSLILTINNDNNELLYTDEEIYHIDMDKFTKAVDSLRPGGLNVTQFSEDHLKGTVTAKKDGVLFTTISYEPGWTIYVDGQKTDDIPLCDNGVIGVPLKAGTHTIEMRFFPHYMLIGIFISIAALAAIIFIAVFESREANKEASKQQIKLNQRGVIELLEDMDVKAGSLDGNSNTEAASEHSNTETASESNENEADNSHTEIVSENSNTETASESNEVASDNSNTETASETTTQPNSDEDDRKQTPDE
jgi:hypothetical protein